MSRAKKRQKTRTAQVFKEICTIEYSMLLFGPVNALGTALLGTMMRSV